MLAQTAVLKDMDYNYDSNANSLLNLALSLICSNKNSNDMLTGTIITDNINHEYMT